MVRFLNVPAVFWLLLSLPGIYWLVAYRLERIFYGEFIHLTGDLSVQLLIVTLALTPLRMFFPKAAWLRWLRARRRYLGVAAFGYALLHTAVYIQRRPDLGFILEDAASAGMWTGWLALLLMLALASTSNDASVRRLGKNWQRLHRGVYVAAVLTFAHWMLTAFDPATAYIYFSILVLIEAIRLSSMGIRYKRE